MVLPLLATAFPTNIASHDCGYNATTARGGHNPVRMRPPHTPCAVGGALRERLMENRMLVHASDGPSQPNYPGPDRVTCVERCVVRRQGRVWGVPGRAVHRAGVLSMSSCHRSVSRRIWPWSTREAIQVAVAIQVLLWFGVFSIPPSTPTRRATAWNGWASCRQASC